MPFAALKESISDREYHKFLLDDDGEHAVRTVLSSSGSTPPLNTTVPSLSTAMRTTTQDITSTVAAMPTTALTDRRTYSVQNLSTTDTLYIGTDTSVTADRVIGITSGWEVGPLETFNTNIQPGIVVYGIAESGKTIRVKILEIA